MADMIIAGQLEELTPERVFIELEKALNTTSPWKFFELLEKIKGLDSIGFEGMAIDLAQFRLACIENENAVVRFATLMSNTDSDAINRLSKHLKMPKKYQEAALLTVKHYPGWQTVNELPADEIIGLIYQLDAYRRPERLEVLQNCGLTLHRSSGNSADHIAHVWRRVFQQTKGVSVKDLETDVQGSEISQAIKTRRIQIVAALKTTGDLTAP